MPCLIYHPVSYHYYETIAGYVSIAFSGWPVLLVAILAVNRPALIRLEGDLGLLATVGTNCIVHLSWASVEATASFCIHGIHVPLRATIMELQWYISVWMSEVS